MKAYKRSFASLGPSDSTTALVLLSEEYAQFVQLKYRESKLVSSQTQVTLPDEEFIAEIGFPLSLGEVRESFEEIPLEEGERLAEIANGHIAQSLNQSPNNPDHPECRKARCERCRDLYFKWELAEDGTCMNC